MIGSVCPMGGCRLYLALYRKYRPRTFDDVISQEHITTTLRNQVASGTAAHAYLFTGSRGTGKTTCAKILAMAVNCQDPQNGNPCLECERCREIANGETTDIVEMDAASNNGVDDVRQLRDEVAYTPVSCKYRVYIIDEVHMLSPAAFNALLKTLEEPPAHVKFILATTELHKVPATISSRCQRFEFRRVDIAESAGRLLDVAEKEGVTLDRDAAELISRLSDGGMRDALSLLDRCISADKHITSQTVRDCAGVADNKHLFAFSEMVANGDVAGCIRLLGELHKNSKDLALVIDELSGHYRDLMLNKTAPEHTDLLSALPEDHENVARIAGLYELDNILRCLTLLQQCADNIGKTKQRRALAEMCLVKMCMGISEQTSSPKPAAKPAPKPTQAEEPIKIVRKPPEQMTEAERQAAKRSQELREQTMKRLTEISEKAEEAPAPETAVKVSEPQASEPPPWDDAPPPEAETFEPPPYEDVPPPMAEPFEPPPYEDAPPEPPKTQPAPISEPVSAPASAPAPEMTDAQWKAVTAKLGMFYEMALAGSSAAFRGSTLEIISSNEAFLSNTRDEKLSELEKNISDILRFPVTLKIIAARNERADQDQSKLDKLLNTAQQLGIKVHNKND